MYKAVIFDLDGTLLDTISDISDSVNAVLRRLNHRGFSEDEYKYFVGRGIDELITTIIEVGELNPGLFQEIKAGYVEEYAKRNSLKTKPYPGIKELLNQVRELGVAICILSNKPHFQTEEVVEKYFADMSFDLIFGKKPEFDIKPNPQSALKILELLDVRSDEVLYVGDTNTDIQTAINAGFKSVGVLWGFRTKAELIEAGADFIAESPQDIYRIVRSDGSDS